MHVRVNPGTIISLADFFKGFEIFLGKSTLSHTKRSLIKSKKFDPFMQNQDVFCTCIVNKKLIFTLNLKLMDAGQLLPFLSNQRW
jgi:hypothetical protein